MLLVPSVMPKKVRLVEGPSTFSRTIGIPRLAQTFCMIPDFVDKHWMLVDPVLRNHLGSGV